MVLTNTKIEFFLYSLTELGRIFLKVYQKKNHWNYCNYWAHIIYVTAMYKNMHKDIGKK